MLAPDYILHSSKLLINQKKVAYKPKNTVLMTKFQNYRLNNSLIRNKRIFHCIPHMCVIAVNMDPAMTSMCIIGRECDTIFFAKIIELVPLEGQIPSKLSLLYTSKLLLIQGYMNKKRMESRKMWNYHVPCQSHFLFHSHCQLKNCYFVYYIANSILSIIFMLGLVEC